MDLHLDLDGAPDRTSGRAPGRSLRARVEHALREAVRDGRLTPGTRLPATRALCAQLGVSRGVVVDAYAQLAAEGYLHTRRGGGTTVAAAVSRERHPTPALTAAAPPRYDMNPYRPALDGFPRTAWSAALGRVLREAPDERLGYPDAAGAPELRTALAAYLGRARGVRAEGEQVVVTCGLRAGMDLLWQVLAARDVRRVALEHPGWAGMHETATAAGLEVTRLELDAEGVVFKDLGEDVDAVALAPAHQYPTGAVLSPARRGALVEWARTHEKLIVEDDYDAEYRYDRQPIGSLQGLAPDRVVYGGSASKTLAPALRMGWLILPRDLAQSVALLQRRRGAIPSTIDQLALADVIERGELDRHLRRQRRRYKHQRTALLDAIATELPNARVSGAAAGLFAVLHLPPHTDETAVLTAARARGIALEGLGGTPPGLVLGYANLPPAAIAPAVRALAASMQETTHRRADQRAAAARSRTRAGTGSHRRPPAPSASETATTIDP